MMLDIYIKQSCVIIITIFFIGGCGSNVGPKVFVELIYSGSPVGSRLYYANVISGGDKFHWYEIYPDKTETITLYPGKHSDSQITLFYQLAADMPLQTWEGPVVQTGQGYRIHITIHESGEISEQFCNLPCD